MTPLPLEKKKDNNIYNFIKRENDIAMYEARRHGVFLGWSVFIVKEQKETILNMGGVSVKLEAKELFPGESAYGKSAWFEKSLQSAETTFNNLLHRKRRTANKSEEIHEN